MSQMPIFVSHSHEDEVFCHALVQALRQAGADVWYDEHNLGTGQLLEEIQRELRARPVFIVILSVSAFISPWVTRECTWAFQLYDRDPSRVLLPVVATPFRLSDFDRLLFLESFKCVAAPNNTPYPQAEAIDQTLALLGLARSSTPTASASPNAESAVAEGWALYNRGQYTEAAHVYRRAVELAPTNESAWFGLGLVDLALGHAPAALTDFECAIILAPAHAEAWGNKGVALMALGRTEEALAAYDRCIELKPTTWDWTRRGEALCVLSRPEEALTAFRHALSSDMLAQLGEDERWVETSAWKGLSSALRTLGQITEADEAERRANKLGG